MIKIRKLVVLEVVEAGRVFSFTLGQPDVTLDVELTEK